MRKSPKSFALGLVLAWVVPTSLAFGQVDYQYDFKSIQIAPASADEPLAPEFSGEKAMAYLDQGAASRMPGLVEERRKQALIETVLSHQRKDGGWSIRTFAAPDKWGDGSREEKLRSEPEFADPPSDGHQTGLAIVVLREAGLPANDIRLQKGIRWLLENQTAVVAKETTWRTFR